jgi:hypothetical protein
MKIPHCDFCIVVGNCVHQLYYTRTLCNFRREIYRIILVYHSINTNDMFSWHICLIFQVRGLSEFSQNWTSWTRVQMLLM